MGEPVEPEGDWEAWSEKIIGTEASYLIIARNKKTGEEKRQLVVYTRKDDTK